MSTINNKRFLISCSIQVALINHMEAIEIEAVKITPPITDINKPNMSFYQTKMHRRKKGGRVNFR